MQPKPWECIFYHLLICITPVPCRKVVLVYIRVSVTQECHFYRVGTRRVGIILKNIMKTYKIASQLVEVIVRIGLCGLRAEALFPCWLPASLWSPAPHPRTTTAPAALTLYISLPSAMFALHLCL